MEDRYEIRGKIGQGGLGSVYRGYDTRMNREVAIKRISTGGGDPQMQEESTRQLIKEAGALASLQHPHIVTVYDVGTDEDGPYVVMELLSGNPLDELIERAPLTWQDFRELALQTQEALIAAHELDLIHSDIKPSNLMLSWLPSGKFQVKIVDFGLATLAKSQSQEELEQLEAVFGSIFFMPPEQFERKPLDVRSDIYSMGCVYYQALAGSYPFDGTTGTEVMNAHLQHTVKPLQHVRADIPVWVCDWIMWQINRQPEDRPESARESLSVFLQNDKNPTPTMSLGVAPASISPPRPRLVIPGSGPPQSRRPGAPIPAAIPANLQPDPVDHSDSSLTKTAPQPLLPPEGFKPSVHTSPHDLPPPTQSMATAQLAPAGPQRTVPTRPMHGPTARKKGKKGVSDAMKGVIAALAAALAILGGWFFIKQSAKKHDAKVLKEIIQTVSMGDSAEVSVDKKRLSILLNGAAKSRLESDTHSIQQALVLAKATDGTDVDAAIADFATKEKLPPEARDGLLRDVLGPRKNPSVLPVLMEFAKSSSDPAAKVAALEAASTMASEEHYNEFFQIVQGTPLEEVRLAAEQVVGEIILKSANRESRATQLADAHAKAPNENARLSLLRLLGRCGGPKAKALVEAALASSSRGNQAAAVVALGFWPDDSTLPMLIDFMKKTWDPQLHDNAFSSALRLATSAAIAKNPSTLKSVWEKVAPEARGPGEQGKVIRALAQYDQPWVLTILENYTKSQNSGVAEQAKLALEEIKARKGGK